MNSYYPPDHMYNLPTRHYQLPHHGPSVGMGTVQQQLPPTPPPSYSLFPPSTPTNQYNDLASQDPNQTWLHSYEAKREPTNNLPLLGSSPSMVNSYNTNVAGMWLHPYEAKSEPTNNLPILGSSPWMVNSYNTNVAGMLHMQPGGESRKSSAEDLSFRLAQRRKRRLTEPGDANYHCQTCGKYFSRIWNYNAHRETHDPTRPKPHICQIASCQRAFVRLTDLRRHIQCVCLTFFFLLNSFS